MGRASSGSNTPHWIRNNILDFLRALSVKIAVDNAKIVFWAPEYILSPGDFYYNHSGIVEFENYVWISTI